METAKEAIVRFNTQELALAYARPNPHSRPRLATRGGGRREGRNSEGRSWEGRNREGGNREGRNREGRNWEGRSREGGKPADSSFGLRKQGERSNWVG